ncbi:hypothetical protein ACHHYP_14924 [Achlya hypogyna]|uniref:Mitochondrial splicing suppressor 51-like C-terminal domain-containing protein n=1 Tax=Achlya hypogyna TaxID=1202772 RepID=A0A1V9YC12_ACHHY|nr:hypothetical protein ACHHYP_14924 [Achlya hypogyna]
MRPSARAASSEATPAYWSFPCPICGGVKNADVLVCSPACDAALAKDHSVARAKLLSLRDDAIAAKSPVLHEVVKLLATHKLTTAYSSWESLVEAIGAPALDEAALRVLSAAYSYPMTLRHYLPALDLAKTNDLRPELFVLGARAEAMMPRHMWSVLAPSQLRLKMIGNHVPVLRKLPPEGADDAVHVSFCSQLFHEMPTVAAPDAFVLFNPGLGHPALRALWAPTLRLALASRKPLLITCFSATDLHRDLEALDAMAAELPGRLVFAQTAQLNPFQSRKATVDPLALLAPVQTNQFALVVRLT